MYESYFVISSFQLGFYLTKIKVSPQQWTMFFICDFGYIGHRFGSKIFSVAL